MRTGLRYRGAHLTREVGDKGWIVDGVFVPLTWNGALALVDSRNIGPAPFSLICRECGERELAIYIEECRQRLMVKSLCFGCDHFDELHHRLGKRTFAHNGSVYTIGSSRAFMKGFGGRRFKVTWLDGHVVEGDSLWHNGEVPEHFRDRFADTARLEWVPFKPAGDDQRVTFTTEYDRLLGSD